MTQKWQKGKAVATTAKVDSKGTLYLDRKEQEYRSWIEGDELCTLV